MSRKVPAAGGESDALGAPRRQSSRAPRARRSSTATRRLRKDARETTRRGWLRSRRRESRQLRELYIYEATPDACSRRVIAKLAPTPPPPKACRCARYDWLGGFGKARGFWRYCCGAASTCAATTPHRLDSTFGWCSRGPQQMLAVDAKWLHHRLCVGQIW